MNVWTNESIKTIIDRYPQLVNFLAIPALNDETYGICMKVYKAFDQDFPTVAKMIDAGIITEKILLVRDV